jgi:putative hydrolases of HD superfamily
MPFWYNTYMSILRDLQLIYEVGMLRNIPRAWCQVMGMDVANLAEHHFRIAWIAMILAKHEGVTNIEKILKMALVHDVAESRTGDVHYVSRLYTKRDEHIAIKDILQSTEVEEDLLSIIEEYEKRESIESRIVKDADSLDVDLELHELKQGTPLEKRWHDIRKESVFPHLYTESAKKIWELIYDSDPHDWHILGKNRHTAGDWKEANEKNKSN